MSCGHAHGEGHDDVDCSTVLDQLYVYIDGELDVPTLTLIQRHLEDCEPCLAEHDLDSAIKALLARSCHEQAPATLRARILTRIAQLRPTPTAEA